MHARTNRRNVASVKPTASRVPTAGKAQARSRLSNGRDVLPDVDGRSVVARRYRDIIGAVVSDQGGAGHLSEARLQLIRRFSAASVLAEQMEARLARGEQINIQEYSLLVSTIVRAARAHRDLKKNFGHAFRPSSAFARPLTFVVPGPTCAAKSTIRNYSCCDIEWRITSMYAHPESSHSSPPQDGR
jgi:hypothetical protein